MNSRATDIPQPDLERAPLLSPLGFAMLARLREHPDAPHWNYEVGDRLRGEDLAALDAFRADLAARREPYGVTPPPRIIAWLQDVAQTTPFIAGLIQGLDLDGSLERDWPRVRAVTRRDIAQQPHALVPDHVLGEHHGLDRLIVYDTSGSTGESLDVPHHPRAMAAYLPLMELALARYGVTLDLGPHRVSHVNLSARAACVTFPAVLTAWNQAGFAKLNLNDSQWKDRDQARRFLKDLDPQLVAGDPVSLAELMAWDAPVAPRILVTTAATLEPALKERLAGHFACPVMDWYSTTETGPVAYACRLGHGFHVLAHDVFVEAVDEHGDPAKGLGDLAVTGGRNPFLPLVRYSTGDRGRMDFSPCPCGDPMPRILDLSARRQVMFRAASGSLVNQADVAMALREILHARHRLVQRADNSLELTLKPVPNWPIPMDQVRRKLAELFGDLPIRVAADPAMADKGLPYVREG